jgi:hypothetical protein
VVALLSLENQPGLFFTFRKNGCARGLYEEIAPKLDLVPAKPFTQIFLYATSGA